MLASVDLNPIKMFEAMTGPRFSQPWTRPQYGDFQALLFETSMLLYLVPPLAGIIVSQPRKFGLGSVILSFVMFAVTLFYSVSTGTRNMTAIFTLTFVAAVLFSSRGRLSAKHAIVVALAGFFLVLSSQIMLSARNVGLAQYVEQGGSSASPRDSEFFVDYNLWAIATATRHFPAQSPYLGWEILGITLARPVPRAVWPGKPSEMSISLEELAGVDGMMTMAASFVGEGFMSSGYFGVLSIGLFFGCLARWWTAQTAAAASDFGVVIYAAGLYGLGIAMRSVTWFVTGMMPAAFLLIVLVILMRLKPRSIGN
jgi:hypothetical protein